MSWSENAHLYYIYRPANKIYVRTNQFTVRCRYFIGEDGKRTYIRYDKIHGKELLMYPNIPRKIIYLRDVVYIKEGKYRGNTGPVVKKYPGGWYKGPCAYVWVSCLYRGKNKELCVPVSHIDIVHHSLGNYTRRSDGYLGRPLYPKGYREYIASCLIYDNWVASFRDGDNEPLTQGERTVLNAIKKKYTEDVDDIPDWIEFKSVTRPWGDPIPYNISAYLGLGGNYPWKRVMWTIQSLIRKRRLVVLPYKSKRYQDRRRRFEIVDF